MIVNRGPQLVQLTNGVPVAPVGGIAQFGRTVGAHRDVGRGQRAAAARPDVSAISKPVPPTSGISCVAQWIR